jgi:NTP pyrophosphatase (non-canonical NTP hydrolase)
MTGEQCRVAKTEQAIRSEMVRGEARYGPFNSTHEGLGVLIEEMYELIVAVHSNELGSVRAEAVQVAAVAWRLALSLDNAETQDRSAP